MTDTSVHIHWFRRDLRLYDHRALHAAVRSGYHVLPLFIFDTDILNALQEKQDRRVHFIHAELNRLNRELQQAGSGLVVRHGNPLEIWKELIREWSIASVSVVRDYEPYARERDREICKVLRENGIRMTRYKDQVIFEKAEILTAAGEPYKVFTPYAKSWKRFLDSDATRAYTVDKSCFLKVKPQLLPSLKTIGFIETDESLFPSRSVGDDIFRQYDERRDTPSLNGTSRLSVHLRYGTVSLRNLVKRAQNVNSVFLNALIWRDFFQMVLYHNPESLHKAIRPVYDNIRWENRDDHFIAWCEGRTGYPMVDAGMRELNLTGYMHNRIRMVTASFLTKHLLIDWRKGERYFAKKLLDFDLAANIGGWQWAAGSGYDAAPYFRIFNPSRQLNRYDPNRLYVRRFLPLYGSDSYPEPIVDHAVARRRALDRFSEALKS